jgi:hypothetical protein
MLGSLVFQSYDKGASNVTPCGSLISPKNKVSSARSVKIHLSPWNAFRIPRKFHPATRLEPRGVVIWLLQGHSRSLPYVYKALFLTRSLTEKSTNSDVLWSLPGQSIDCTPPDWQKKTQHLPSSTDSALLRSRATRAQPTSHNRSSVIIATPPLGRLINTGHMCGHVRRYQP